MTSHKPRTERGVVNLPVLSLKKKIAEAEDVRDSRGNIMMMGQLIVRSLYGKVGPLYLQLTTDENALSVRHSYCNRYP